MDLGLLIKVKNGGCVGKRQEIARFGAATLAVTSG
jgi:hypothetical protein